MGRDTIDGSITHVDHAVGELTCENARLGGPTYMREPGRWVRSGLLVLAVVAAAIGGSAAADVGTMAVNETDCGSPPPALSAGPMSFTFANQADVAVTVYLIGPNANVYAETSAVVPSRSLPLATTLGGGDYWLRCVFADGAVRTSPGFSVSGHAGGAVVGYRPLAATALIGPAMVYTRWVNARLPELLSAVLRLDHDVAGGHLAAARVDWLTAHLIYERLGAAYDAFGHFDADLDGLGNGRPSTHWTGFHAVEYALWHPTASATLRGLAVGLVASVQGLIRDFPSEEVDPMDLPLRAHDILEDSMEVQFTGAADFGSHTSLATAYANTQGTDEVLSVLAPLIRQRDPSLLGSVDRELTRVQHDLLAARMPSGAWTLPAGDRPHLDADADALLEQLSAVPNLLTPRTDG